MPTTPVLWRNIGQVNTVDSGLNGDDQVLPAVVQLANGNVLVTWQSNTDVGSGSPIGTDVIGQILDPAGNKVGGEFTVNTLWTQWNEGAPAVAALGNGGFAAVYERHDAAKGGGDRSITLEIFNAAGTSTHQVSIAADVGTAHYGLPDIAYSTSGNLMVAYVRDYGGGDQDVLFQVRNGTGGLVSGPTLALNGAAAAGAGIDSLSVAALNSGNFVLAFSDADSATDSDIDLRLYSSTGTLIKNVSVASGTIRNDDVDVTALKGGGFVVTWTQDGSGGSDSAVLAKVYDAAGTALTSNITVPTTGAGNQNESSVGALADGGFVVAWIDDQIQDLRAQRFDAAGNKVGVEFLVYDGALISPDTPVVTGLADGRFTITWMINGIISDHDIGSAIFDPRDFANVGTAGDDVIAGTVGDDADLSGGLGNDRIYGGGGNDLLNGGSGADVLDGGDGIDTASYAGAGTGVHVSLATGLGSTGEATGDTLTGIENLTGSAHGDTLIGDAGANVLSGGGSVDHLTGGLGADTLIGGDGTDVAHYNDAAGDLVVSLANPASNTGEAAGDTFDSIEGISAGAGNDTLTGDGQTNFLFGGGGNDVLDGGAGFDFLYGGTGDDIFIVDNLNDGVTEFVDEGTDTVKSSVNWGLGGFVENLTLTGTADIFGAGNGQANTIIGNSGANLIDGLAGADTMAGGTGNDTYIVDNAGDVVTELGNQGTDAVQSSVSFTLGSNVENLTLTGAANIGGTGNTLANVITGNAGSNVLDGKGGADTLIGGAGQDTYYVDNVGDVLIEDAVPGTDTVYASVTYTLGANVETLVLTGVSIIDGTGNGLDNLIIGNGKKNLLTGLGGNDVLDGGMGADTLVGGIGDDTYVVDNAADVVTELGNQGNDRVESAVTYTLAANIEELYLSGADNIGGTGNTLANKLLGNIGNNFLNGVGGADTMIGGEGDDTYIVDNVGDVVTEISNEGYDTVQSSVTYTISPDIEKLILTGNAIINGTGNEQFNTIIGNAKANVLTGLEGDDVLDGQAGADTMIGGIQDDTYYVDNAGDTIVEGDQSDDGLDSVFSSISYTLADNVENLTLTGASNINGTGNASMNVLTGNDKNNILDGGAGADELWGGLGNDTYHFDDMGDFLIEEAGGGIDKVFSSVGFSAAAQEIEYITLTGTDAVNADGNAIANTITGNGANNVLKGGLGNDTFVFSTALGATNIDSLLDFATTIDKIALDDAIFTKAGPLGALADGAFAMGTAATEADDRILYDTVTGALYYDVDGNKVGGLDAVQFAFLESGMDDLAASEFLVV